MDPHESGARDEEPITITPYDNDITLLYKATAIYEVPIKLIIARPRLAEDDPGMFGTDEYVYESFFDLIPRMLGTSTPSQIWTYVQNYNKIASEDDIIMVYYNLLQMENPDGVFHEVLSTFNRELLNESPEDPHKYNDEAQLERAYEAWADTIQQDLVTDTDRLNTIIDIQHNLEQVNLGAPIPVGPLTVRSTEMSYTPTLRGMIVSPDDGLEIFNQSIVSAHVPYIRYNDPNGHSYYRIYTGDRVENAPNYDVMIPHASKTSAKNTIYLRLWYGDPHDEGAMSLKGSPKGLFRTVVYYLDPHKRRNDIPFLLIKSPIEDDIVFGQQLGKNRVQAALPILEFGDGVEINVQGEFNIMHMDYDETSLLHMILLDPTLNVYLYVEENIEPFAFKERLGIHYRAIFTDINEGKTATEEAYIQNFASVSVTLTQRYTTSEMSSSSSTVEDNAPYVHVNISRAESREVVEKFIPIFVLLLRYHQLNRDPIINIYSERLSIINTLSSHLERKRQRNLQSVDASMDRREDSRIRRLQELAPDLIVTDYSVDCQQKRQPLIIAPEEEAMWRARRVEGKERQIMPFPKDNPRWLFVCPTDEAPYPGVKFNKNLPNKEQYPYIPCCSPKDQLSKPNSKYMRYLSNQPSKVDTCSKKILTRKILPGKPGCYGSLPSAINDIVKRYSNTYADMIRIGIPKSTNSMLHCVAMARDETYIILRTPEEKENYVKKLRRQMSRQLHPALLKQELYDYTEDEIRALIADNTKFLDPALFYRCVEEMYGVNIYVFSSNPPSGTDLELGSLEIPRYKIFHARPIRLDRPTVVILKTTGGKMDKVAFPHCELIVDYNETESTMIKIFGPGMTEVCHSTLRDSYTTITASPLPDGSFDTRANVYYYIDHLSIFQQWTPVSQMIDENGKMRAVTFNMGTDEITIATIPSQPENLPIQTESARTTAETVQRIFGTPSSITYDLNGRVDGVWIQILDIEDGEYIPIAPTREFRNLREGPPNPIISSHVNITRRLSRLRRTLNIIIHLVKWIFEVARRDANMTPEQFARTYFDVKTTRVHDSATYYDIHAIPSRLPEIASARAGLKYLEQLAPTLVRKNKFIMYSPAFAQRMVGMLHDFYNARIGTHAAPITFIDNYFENANDFRPVPYSKVLMGDHDFTAWMQSLKASQNYSAYYNINQRVDPNMSSNLDPYLYQDTTGAIYDLSEDDAGAIFIVQNVVGGSYIKAITVAAVWGESQVNIGPDPIPQPDIPLLMIYCISPSGTIVPVDDLTNGYTEFIQLLYYGSAIEYEQVKMAPGRIDRYAALLEL